VPTPGHLLLLNGRLPVYPSGFECQKCSNTGLKNYDPTHRCRKCWKRHASPYADVLAYTSWPNNSNSNNNASVSASRSNFQKPLPNFRPAGAPGAGGGRRRKSRRRSRKRSWSWSREQNGRGVGVGVYSSRRRITALHQVQTSLIPLPLAKHNPKHLYPPPPPPTVNRPLPPRIHLSTAYSAHPPR